MGSNEWDLLGTGKAGGGVCTVYRSVSATFGLPASVDKHLGEPHNIAIYMDGERWMVRPKTSEILSLRVSRRKSPQGSTTRSVSAARLTSALGFGMGERRVYAYELTEDENGKMAIFTEVEGNGK